MVRAEWNGAVLAESASTVRLEGNHYAAGYYPHPSPLARKSKDRVAFWRGVIVVEDPAERPSERRALLQGLGGLWRWASSLTRWQPVSPRCRCGGSASLVVW